MKKMILFLLLVSFGCKPQAPSGKVILSVSILPQKFFVEKIAGTQVEVNVLVPPGASPEFYSLMPSQMRDLSKSAAWLRIGKIGFEESWVEKIKQSNPDLHIFDTSAGADWISSEEETPGEHSHLHGVDPHIWMAPDEVKKIALETYKALLTILPKQEKLLTVNYKSFIREIDQLDQELKSRFGHLQNRRFLIFHPALSYLARQYNLEQIPLEVEGKEPSPKYMRSLVEQAKAGNIHVIFIQKEFGKDNARQLADEINGEVVQIDPLDEQWDEQLKEIAQKITEASQK